MTQPFAEAALELFDRGWCPFPLPERKKSPPLEGYTGHDGIDADVVTVRDWVSRKPESNVATRAPANVVGVDVDQYGDKQGGTNLAQFRLDHDLERLPKTVVSSSKPYPSGIHWFQVSEACPKLAGAPVKGVEIVQRHHRYAVLPPSVHPDTGDEYRWIDHRTGEILEAAPHTDELPWLPWGWIEALTKATVEADPREPVEWEPTVGEVMDARVAAQLDRFDTTPGGRHDMMCEIQMALVRYESLGLDGSTYALSQLRRLFIATVVDERDGGLEFDTALETARGKVAVTESTLTEAPTIELATAEPTEVEAPETSEETNRILAGLITGSAILDMPPPDPMVGEWLDKGMVFTMVGSYGSAKTFALLDMAMAVTTGQQWLGEDIHHTGRVLYVVAEGGYTIGQRIAGWVESRGWKGGVPEDFLLFPDRIDLLNAAHCYDLSQACEKLEPALVIIDTMAQSMPGGDENSSEVMSKLFATTDQLRKDTGASVGFARHTGHSATKRGRGFSGFDDNSDVIMAMEGQMKDGGVVLSSEKQKNRDNPPPIHLGMATTDMGAPYLVVKASGPDNGPVDERMTKTKTAILSTVRRWGGQRPLSRDEWLERTPDAGKKEGIACFMELVDNGWFVGVAGDLFEPNSEMFA